MILETIADNYLWFLVFILVANLSQRRHQSRSRRKRVATLVVACLAMLLQIFITVILAREWPHWLFFPALAITLLLIIPLKKYLFVFKTTCASCDKKLTFTQVFNFDDNLCTDCYAKEHPELVEKTEPEEIPVEPKTAVDFEQIDWDAWEPTETAVICYVVDHDQILLIHKKRGLGSGLVNAPGGHIELEETASEAAIRETKEETGIVVENPIHMGILEFQFTDGLAMRGHVFFSYSHSGTLIETDEAAPFWCPIKEIPYEKMWEDDRLWLPLALEGIHFVGHFIFDDKTMLSHHIEQREPE